MVLNSKKYIKNIVRKAMCCLLTSAMLLSGSAINILSGIAIEVQAATELTYTEGNSTYTYKVNSDDTVRIMGYSGTDNDIVIPDEIEGKSVTIIWSGTFYGCSSLTSVKIPESVTDIDANAFASCSSLTSIEVSEKNEVYDSRNDCNAIIETKTNTLIQGCSTTKIPVGITDIADYAFSDCSSLTSVKIPEGVTSIGYGAFSGCSSLTSVKIPESVTSIWHTAFKDCSSLTSIEVSEKNEVYDSRNDCNAIIETKTNTLIQGCSTTKIPVGITDIADYAFSCISLTSVYIPESVTSIGLGAFSGCSSLKSVSIPESVTNIGGYAFVGCSGLTSIEVSEKNEVYDSRNDCNAIIETKTNTLIQGCSTTKIPESVTSIGLYAFSDCSSLVSVKIPEGVTSIGYGAFSDCSSLISVNIPEGVTSIGDSAFQGCNSLKNITIPKRVTEIGYRALGYYYGEKCADFTISGYSRTAAETYANENGFKFIELKMAESDEGIKVEYEKDLVVDGADITLVTKRLAEGDKEHQSIVIADKILDENVKPEKVKFTAFDITLKDVNGAAVQPKGNIIVKMPVPDGYNGNNCKVYRVNDNGSFTDMEAACVNGFMVFETNHFSTYLITETELKAAPAAIFGDANSDGAVNSKDVVMLKKHLAGYKVDINLAACDVNGDKHVNSKDVVMVMKKLAGYDVVLGEQQ